MLLPMTEIVSHVEKKFRGEARYFDGASFVSIFIVQFA